MLPSMAAGWWPPRPFYSNKGSCLTPAKREPGQRALAWQTSLGKTWMSLRRGGKATAPPRRGGKGSRVGGGAGGGGRGGCGGVRRREGLPLADPVHLRAAHGASALCGRPAVLQGHLLRVPHLPLGATLQAIGLHILPPCWVIWSLPFCCPSIPIFKVLSRG